VAPATAARPAARRGTVRTWAPVAYPAFLVLLTVVQVGLPRRSGPLALAQVFLPWLFLPLVALLPLAVLLPTRRLTAALLAAAVAFTVHIGPEWVPSGRSAPDPRATDVRVVSWNVLVHNRPANVTAAVERFDADVIGLVEVNQRQAEALAADPMVRGRYRTALLYPEAGRALLSRYRVLAATVVPVPGGRRGTGVLRARLDLGGGRELTVVVAHPLPPRARPSSELPLHWDAGPRDAEIRFVRGLVGAEVASGRRVLLLGDFNVTVREPAGPELARGLTDAHDAVGWGPGASWAPLGLRRRGIALVRIDRVLAGPGVVPTAFGTDCAFRGSDHCVLRATVAVAP
jgi:vancomycin resistance protein VanJ